ncbi:MAG: xylulokinase [Geminicoccaceae bacterium]|nr:MAG: xylulokinase [Geminicoccaceae bacterium]
MGTYLGIDIGTSEVKTVLLDADQAVVASARAQLSVQRPEPGWSEQDPEQWWEATKRTLDELKAAAPKALAAVRGIGLSGQMHGATLLDAADQPLRPCILWNDGRSAVECEELTALADFHGIGGNLVMPGFTAPKLRWVAKHEPAVFRRIAKVLLPKDYVRLRLTGEHVSEMSDSAGTLWLDVQARSWSPQLLGATELDERQMPRLVEGSEPGGELFGELAERWGMAGAPVVAGGGGDNAASACGIGAVEAGRAFLSLGTSGVLFVATDRFRPNVASAVHAFCHALPDSWHQMAVVLAATDSLNWLARLLKSDAASLTAALGDELLGPSPVLFLPYLGGERTPHNDAAIRGAFAGLSQTADDAVLTRAVLEGVAFGFKDGFTALQEAGSDVEAFTAVGGGARSLHWLKLLATILDRPVDVPTNGDFGAAFGAARLGLAAATGADAHGICTQPPIARTIEPDRRWHDAYTERFEHYRALYPALKGAMA